MADYEVGDTVITSDSFEELSRYLAEDDVEDYLDRHCTVLNIDDEDRTVRLEFEDGDTIWLEQDMVSLEYIYDESIIPVNIVDVIEF